MQAVLQTDIEGKVNNIAQMQDRKVRALLDTARVPPVPRTPPFHAHAQDAPRC